MRLEPLLCWIGWIEPVYGGAVPPLVWQTTRQSVIFLWGGIGLAILLIGGTVLMVLTDHR